MTYRVGAKGQVVIPKGIRDRAGILPGDEILFEEVDGMIMLRKAKTRAELAAELAGSLPPSAIDPLEVLAEERRREREHEDRKFGERG